MVPDRQKVWTDGQNGRTGARTMPKLYNKETEINHYCT